MTLALRAIEHFDQQRKSTLLLLALLAILVLGLVDYATGYEAFFAFFYLFPVSFVAWHVGRRWGAAFSIISVVTWLVANLLAGETHAQWWIPYWNTFARLVVFLLVTALSRPCGWPRSAKRSWPGPTT